jgi:hypothetical protein
VRELAQALALVAVQVLAPVAAQVLDLVAAKALGQVPERALGVEPEPAQAAAWALVPVAGLALVLGKVRDLDSDLETALAWAQVLGRCWSSLPNRLHSLAQFLEPSRSRPQPEWHLGKCCCPSK